MLIHIDGDAFFASVYQSMHAHARGKPVAIGRERGIITALSYEAKKLGIKRGMLGHEAKKICPQLLLVSSDYRAYQLFSNKMVAIALMYSPFVECYSIDEVFMQVTGFDTVHHMSYEELGHTLKNRIEQSLGLTVSVGIAPTKTLAKIASNAQKPSGLVALTDENHTTYLQNTAIEDVWGIGYRLAIRMRVLGIKTAHDLAHSSEALLRSKFNKTVMQTWYELRGIPMFRLSYGHKMEYKSIQKTATVTPATTDKKLLLARVFHHIERAFVKARRHGYRVQSIDIFLKTQKFTYTSAHISFSRAVAYPYLIRADIRKAFDRIYRPQVPYRATGCTLSNFTPAGAHQQDLFHDEGKLEGTLEKLYHLYESHKIGFGTDLFETHTHVREGMFKSMVLK